MGFLPIACRPAAPRSIGWPMLICEGRGRRGEDKTLLDNGCIIMKRIQLGEGREDGRATEDETGREGGGLVNKHRGKQPGWLGSGSNDALSLRARLIASNPSAIKMYLVLSTRKY